MNIVDKMIAWWLPPPMPRQLMCWRDMKLDAFGLAQWWVRVVGVLMAVGMVTATPGVIVIFALLTAGVGWRAICRPKGCAEWPHGLNSGDKRADKPLNKSATGVPVIEYRLGGRRGPCPGHYSIPSGSNPTIWFAQRFAAGKF